MGTVFLMGIEIFHGYGFGTTKPSGFVPVAISRACSSARSPARPSRMEALDLPFIDARRGSRCTMGV
jgi:hypothetical protein